MTACTSGHGVGGFTYNAWGSEGVSGDPCGTSTITGAIPSGDYWLCKNIPDIQAAVGSHGAVIIAFDEGNTSFSSSTQDVIPGFVLPGSGAMLANCSGGSPCSDTTFYDQTSILKALTLAFGLNPSLYNSVGRSNYKASRAFPILLQGKTVSKATSTPSRANGRVPQKVALVIMENHSYWSVTPNATKAPYEHGLATTAGVITLQPASTCMAAPCTTGYHEGTSNTDTGTNPAYDGSAPEYAFMTSGDTCGDNVTDATIGSGASYGSSLCGQSVFQQMDRKGISWAVYSEDYSRRILSQR